jgi:hypothetical protein
MLAAFVLHDHIYIYIYRLSSEPFNNETNLIMMALLTFFFNVTSFLSKRTCDRKV